MEAYTVGNVRCIDFACPSYEHKSHECFSKITLEEVMEEQAEDRRQKVAEAKH